MFRRLLSHQEFSAALLLATALLPVLASVGTPTYTVFSIMVCSFAMAWGWSSLDDALGFVDRRFTIPLYVALLLLLVGLRSGLNVPIISKLSQPILAEKEKTFQLETIIEWMMTSSYAGEDLSIGQESPIPREAGKKAIDRTHRPPTHRFYLRKYLVWRRGEVSEAPASEGRLVVFFGGEELEDREPVFRVVGDYAETASVYWLSQ